MSLLRIQAHIDVFLSHLVTRISLGSTPQPPLNVRSTDTLRVTFTVTDKSSGKGVQPHQTFIRFYDPATKEEGIQPIRVSPAGKAKFDLVSFAVLRLPATTCLES
jgi:oligosaccharyltransferase complex subunit delta (ribophorin II)